MIIKVKKKVSPHNPDFLQIQVLASEDKVKYGDLLKALVQFKDKESLTKAFERNSVVAYAKQGSRYIQLGYIPKTAYDAYIKKQSENNDIQEESFRNIAMATAATAGLLGGTASYNRYHEDNTTGKGQVIERIIDNAIKNKKISQQDWSHLEHNSKDPRVQNFMKKYLEAPLDKQHSEWGVYDTANAKEKDDLEFQRFKAERGGLQNSHSAQEVENTLNNASGMYNESLSKFIREQLIKEYETMDNEEDYYDEDEEMIKKLNSFWNEPIFQQWLSKTRLQESTNIGDTEDKFQLVNDFCLAASYYIGQRSDSAAPILFPLLQRHNAYDNSIHSESQLTDYQVDIANEFDSIFNVQESMINNAKKYKQMIQEALGSLETSYINGNHGNFIFQLLPNNNLKMTLTPEGKNELMQIKEQYPEWNDYDVMTQLMDTLWGNGWDNVTGNAGLTDAYAFAYDCERNEEGEIINCNLVWAYMDYQVSNMVEQLLAHNEIVFQFGGERIVNEEFKPIVEESLPMIQLRTIVKKNLIKEAFEYKKELDYLGAKVTIPYSNSITATIIGFNRAYFICQFDDGTETEIEKYKLLPQLKAMFDEQDEAN